MPGASAISHYEKRMQYTSVSPRLSFNFSLSLQCLIVVTSYNHTGKCIRRFACIYAYCRCFIDRMW